MTSFPGNCNFGSLQPLHVLLHVFINNSKFRPLNDGHRAAKQSAVSGPARENTVRNTGITAAQVQR